MAGRVGTAPKSSLRPPSGSSCATAGGTLPSAEGRRVDSPGFRLKICTGEGDGEGTGDTDGPAEDDGLGDGLGEGGAGIGEEAGIGGCTGVWSGCGFRPMMVTVIGSSWRSFVPRTETDKIPV